MRTYIIMIVMLILAFSPFCYTAAALSAEPPCNTAFENADIGELKSSLNQLAELQRKNADQIEFSPKNIIKIGQFVKTAQGCILLFIAPYEMLGVDGGNAVYRYIAVFEVASESPLGRDLRKAAHLIRKHFALTGLYPVGLWGRIEWRRATISNNQVTVPAESLLCTKYRCCNGGPGLVLIDISVLYGQVVTNVTDEYNGSNDSSKCP